MQVKTLGFRRYCVKILALISITCFANLTKAQSDIPVLSDKDSSQKQDNFPTYPFAVFTGSNTAVTFLDENYQELFKLPIGHHPLGTHPLSNDFKLFSRASGGKGYDIMPFRDGICSIKASIHHSYWINEQGETIVDFGSKYRCVSPVINGFALALKQEGHNRMVFFLDRSGKEVFSGKYFAVAQPFSDGLAAVQLIDDKNNWYFINTDGEIVFQLPHKEGTHVSIAQNFANGLCLVKYHNLQTYRDELVFIDKDGVETINVTQINPYEHTDYSTSFKDNISVIATSDALWPPQTFQHYTFIDKNGTVLKEFTNSAEEGLRDFISYYSSQNIFTYSKSSGGISRVNFFTGNSDINQEDEKLSTFTYPPGHKPRRINLLSTSTALIKTRMDKEFFHFLFDMKTGEILSQYQERPKITYESEKSMDNFHVYYDLNDGSYIAKDNRGNQVWANSISNNIYKSLKRALLVKEQVKKYRVEPNKSSDFENGLLELKNLEYLQINCDIIPENISQLEQLKTIEICYSNFKTLPKSMAQLQQLEVLKIWRCEHYESGIEYVIENAPNLTHVTITNVKLEDGFIEKMKQLKPELTINSSSWTSFR